MTVDAVADPGRQVGAYTIDRLLGRGGMGEVWLASRSDGRFEGRSAIKFLRASAAQLAPSESFRYEAALLGRLAHPHIARLFDAGATPEGEQFLVLEYVDGLFIDEYCERNALPVRARVRLFLDAVDAVAHAHTQLIVHRDLKPSNVLVTRDGTVKLLDFGIAKLLDPAQAPGDGTATCVEEIAVTPEYAAPEQLLGERTSTATDVYQLGMLLYVLLAGRHPLQLSGSRSERIKAAASGKMPRASDFAASALRKQLRGDLDAILGKALHSSPQERYQTAAALRDDLVRHLNREPVNARRGTRLYSLARFTARHRAATTASLMATLTLCGMLIFAVAQARVAAAERDHALSLASRNSAVTEFLGTVITEAAAGDKPVTVTEMLARSEKLALADTTGNPENRAAVLAMIGARYGTVDDYVTATRLLDSGLALLVNSQDHGLRAEISCMHAVSISRLGQADAAVRELEHDLALLQDDPRRAAYCLMYRAAIAGDAHDAEPALRFAKESLERFHAAPPLIADDEALFLEAVGWGYHLNGQNREADDYYRRAMQIYIELGREASESVNSVRNNWAVVVSSAGAPKRALAMYDRTLQLFSERGQGEDPAPAVVGNRARALEQIGRYAEARTAYAMELRIGDQKQIVFAQAQALAGLASIAQVMHENTAAAQYLERLTAIITPAFPAGAPQWMTRSVVQGKLDMDAGRFEAARAQFASALRNPNTTTGMTARLGKSEAELRAGDNAAAAEDARLALQTATAMQGDLPYSHFTGLSWLALGRAQLQLGKPAEARQAFESARVQLSNTVDDNQPALIEVRKLVSNAQTTGS